MNVIVIYKILGRYQRHNCLCPCQKIRTLIVVLLCGAGKNKVLLQIGIIVATVEREMKMKKKWNRAFKRKIIKKSFKNYLYRRYVMWLHILSQKVEKNSMKAKPQRQTSEERRILCRPGSVKILKTKVTNGKVILTARRLRNLNWDRNEIGNHAQWCICFANRNIGQIHHWACMQVF